MFNYIVIVMHLYGLLVMDGLQILRWRRRRRRWCWHKNYLYTEWRRCGNLCVKKSSRRGRASRMIRRSDRGYTSYTWQTTALMLRAAETACRHLILTAMLLSSAVYRWLDSE